jgi:hypothetical protein
LKKNSKTHSKINQNLQYKKEKIPIFWSKQATNFDGEKREKKYTYRFFIEHHEI